MLVELQQDRKVRVLVRHPKKNHFVGGEGVVVDKISHRQTQVIIKDATQGDHEPVIVEGTALCFDPDQFSRKEGRKRAILRAFQHDQNHILTKEDRKRIFRVVCPEFFS